MKQKITLSDIINLLNYFKSNYIDARLQKVYDINSKSFLLKFTLKNKEKKFVIFDANVQSLRFHETNHNFERRKIPSSFCAKLRKHIINKKLTNISQINNDKIVDFTFGNDKKYHLILELYDKGNLILADEDYKVLNLIRRHTFSDDTKLAVDSTYPILEVKEFEFKLDLDHLVTTPISGYGREVLRYCLKNSSNEEEFYQNIQKICNSTKGYLIYKKKIKESYCPFLLNEDSKHKKFDNLSLVLDEYYKPDIKKKVKKLKSKEKAVKTIKKHNEKKIQKLRSQLGIITNIISYLEMNTKEFENLQNFNPNFIVTNVKVNKKDKIVYYPTNDMIIELNYNMNIWNNIKLYYQKKKDIEIKINKTIKGCEFAVKRYEENNTKKKVKYIKLDVKIKQFWFEKFKWFISSEGYLVLLGKSAHQNEELVNKHMTNKDIYVHSETPGSGSCIIKDINGEAIEDMKTLREAVCYVVSNSKSWKNNLISRGYWVYPNQVSKTPESGEFIQTGSFIIRGKRNYVTPKLELGFGLLFKKKGSMELKNLVRSGKEIEWVVPMLAPFNALKEFKFAVKLVPGKNKINKTIGNIKQFFMKKGNFIEKSLLYYTEKDRLLNSMINHIYVKY